MYKFLFAFLFLSTVLSVSHDSLTNKVTKIIKKDTKELLDKTFDDHKHHEHHTEHHKEDNTEHNDVHHTEHDHKHHNEHHIEHHKEHHHESDHKHHDEHHDKNHILPIIRVYKKIEKEDKKAHHNKDEKKDDKEDETEHEKVNSLSGLKQKDMNKIEEAKIESSPVFKHKPLYYYHLFMSVHNTVSSKVPLKQHYENERKLRIERDNLLNQIDALKREKGFKVRDQRHAILKVENEIIKLNDTIDNVNKIHNQRKTATKFEINHDIMWQKYYQNRLEINNQNLQKALPDDIVGIKALIKNDKERVKFYDNSANGQWETLTNLRVQQNSEIMRLENEIDSLKNELTGVKLRGDQEIRKIKNEIRKFKEQIKPIDETLKADDALDAKRRTNESISMKDINTSA